MTEMGWGIISVSSNELRRCGGACAGGGWMRARACSRVGFAVASPPHAAGVGAVGVDPGGELARVFADHPVVRATGGGEVDDVGVAAVGEVTHGVMHLRVGGGLIAVGC